MKLGQIDPHQCIDHFLLIHCRCIDSTIPTHPRNADWVLAYCFLDPLRGYRLFIFSVASMEPLKLYNRFYISLDIPFYRLRGERVKFYRRSMGRLPDTIYKLLYEIKRSSMEYMMRHLNKMDIEGWKVIRI